MRKTLQDLTIKDNFMFAAVMADPENCKELLEMVLEIPIAKLMCILKRRLSIILPQKEYVLILKQKMKITLSMEGKPAVVHFLVAKVN